MAERSLLRWFGVAALCSAALGCTQTPPNVVLHSMRSSGNTAFVCWGVDNGGQAYRLDDCPDFQSYTRHLMGLVTQTDTNEIAVVDLSGGALADGTIVAPSVVDDDPSTPGYSFLRVGGRPGAIVSSPGGAATFVAVSGLDKNGIFGLPTQCIWAPAAGQAARDLTTWPACALSSAPGDMALLVDSASAPSCQPGTHKNPNDPANGECHADVDHEMGPSGTRVLAVALPDEQRIAFIDAQALLDRPAGSFDSCPELTSRFDVSTAVPNAAPFALPPDLVPAASCPASTFSDLPPAGTSSLLGGFALTPSGDRLYIADRQLPIVHALDVKKPCQPAELPPLRPSSYLDPTRTVTTSRVAVSPLTPMGKQYLYAVDDQDQPASVMAFDVTPSVTQGATDLAPLIFPGAPRQPYVPPDRIRYSSPVRDVVFALRDFPSPDPATGVGQFGTLCDPDPNHPAGTAGTAREPNPPDYTAGARPFELRGVFGFAMMTSGQIGVIDVEDFDAPCRRPATVNSAGGEDFRGCAGDDTAASCKSGEASCFMRGGLYTVTGESSCRMIEAHRARAVFPSVTNPEGGVHSPSLRSFPQFSNPHASDQLTETERPRLLAVDFPNPAASSAAKPLPVEVNVGITPYSSQPNDTETPLDIDPLTSHLPSLGLPLNEPRSYSFDDNLSLVYEGKVVSDRRTGYFRQAASGGWEIFDPDANFCAAGVEDPTQIGAELGNAMSADPVWAASHADHVQITGDFPAQDTNSYWGRVSGCSYDECVDLYGTGDNQLSLSAKRDLPVLAAYFDHLQVDCGSDENCAKLRCCFPAGTYYAVRASQQWLLLSSVTGVAHDIGVVDDTSSPQYGRCVHQAACDPRKQHLRGRAFEVCDVQPVAGQDNSRCGCMHDFTQGPVEPNEPGVSAESSAGSECIFENLTARFVLYRGRGTGDPDHTGQSERDMSFSWQVTGGFAPLTMNLASFSSNVDPRSIVYLPKSDVLAVTDGEALGLSVVSLDTLGIISPSPFF